MRKTITGYEGLYSIDTDGVVYSDEKEMPPSKRYPRGFTRPARALAQCPQTNGYLIVTLSKNNRRRTKQVHKLVADTFIDRPETAECINHIDEDKTNNNVDNLEWVTFQRNSEYSNAKVYKFKYKGEPVVIFNLNKYCKENDLWDHSMRQVLKGKQLEHRGYTL